MPTQPSNLLHKIKFPNIFRRITELPQPQQILYTKIILVSFVSTFLAVAIVLRGSDMLSGIAVIQAAGSKKQEVMNEKMYWQDVIRRKAGYRDAYLKLAVLSYQLGQKHEARVYIQEALAIDPNYEPAQRVAEELGIDR